MSFLSAMRQSKGRRYVFLISGPDIAGDDQDAYKHSANILNEVMKSTH